MRARQSGGIPGPESATVTRTPSPSANPVRMTSRRLDAGTLGHGVAGIGDQIDEHLLQLDPITAGRGRSAAGSVPASTPWAISSFCTRPQRIAHQLVHVDRLALRLASLEQLPQPLDDPRRARDRPRRLSLRISRMSFGSARSWAREALRRLRVV